MLLDFIKSNWKEITTWLALFGVVVEVSPIKIYPLRWVGNRMNADIKKELDNVNENLNKHITDSEKKEMKNLRFQMLDFVHDALPIYLNHFSFDIKVVILFIYCVILLFLFSDSSF